MMITQFESSLVYRNEDAKHQMSNMIQEIRLEKQENDNLKSMVMELSSQIQKLKSSNEEMEHYIEDLQNQKEKLRHEMEDQSFRDVVKDLQKIIQEKQQAINNLKDEKEYFITTI